MKDFITAIASVIILMMFVMQYAANQAAYTKIIGAEYAVREVRLLSENQGMIKSENIAGLKTKLAEILDCGISEIIVDISGHGMDTANESDEPISLNFDVAMPVYGVIGPSAILGIDPLKNVRIHRSSGFIVLDPEPAETETEEPDSPED